MLKTQVLASALFLLALFATGCTNVRSTVSVGTQRFNEVPKEKNYSFDTSTLNPGSTEQELYYAQIEKHLAKLGWQRLPNDDRKADYSIDFAYSPVKNRAPAKISEAPQSSILEKIEWRHLTTDLRKANDAVHFTNPPLKNHASGSASVAMRASSSLAQVSITTGGFTGNPHNTGSGARYATSAPAPTSRDSRAVPAAYTYKLQLSIIQRTTEGKKPRLVNMWETSVTASSDAPEVPRVIPVMIDAIFKNFPGKPDYKYVVTSPVRD